jgi:ABC-type phosphate transport system substrate-binding protein
VIVHGSNPVESLRAGYASQLFLNKISRWEHGEKVKPVDRSPRSATRIEFSKSVHGRPVRAVKSYWQQMIFSGRGLPPPELRSDAEVIEYVRRNPGAIGYVWEGTVLENVKAIEIRK